MFLARRSRPVAVVAAVFLTALVTSLTGLAWAGPNPPGNNGTVKIDDVPFDQAPNNEPHVGCVFEVDFYGYDAGDLFADVRFESHPPTGPVRVLLTDRVFIGEDDNAGGGSQAGLDAERQYTLAFTGIEPHPNQGFHVKLTINAQGSQGADTKYKVFWVTGCEVPPTTTTTSSTTTTTLGETTTTRPGETTTTRPGETTTTTGEETTTTVEETTTTAGVGGSSATSSSPGGGALPFTGASAMPLLMVGLALVGLGVAGVLGRSRRGGTAP